MSYRGVPLIGVFVSLAFTALSQTTINIKENKGPIIKKTEVYQNINPAPRSPAKLRIAPNSPPNIPHSLILESTGQKDSFELRIWVANSGAYTAINLSDTLILVNFYNDKIYFASPALSQFLPDQEIYYNEAILSSYAMKFHPDAAKDSAVMFLKIHYTDSIGTKGVMRSMTRIFPFVLDTDLPSPIPEDYNKIRNFLIASKLW